jgi:hypothetical protein
MKLNISIEAEDLSLWALVKLFLKVAVALMPAVLVWMIVPFVVGLWLTMFQQLMHH